MSKPKTKPVYYADGWKPYIVGEIAIDTKDLADAIDIDDSIVAQWLKNELNEIQRKLSEAYPSKYFTYSMNLTNKDSSLVNAVQQMKDNRENQ